MSWQLSVILYSLLVAENQLKLSPSTICLREMLFEIVLNLDSAVDTWQFLKRFLLWVICHDCIQVFEVVYGLEPLMMFVISLIFSVLISKP